MMVVRAFPTSIEDVEIELGSHRPPAWQGACLFSGTPVVQHDFDGHPYGANGSDDEKQERQSRVTKDFEARVHPHHQGCAHGEAGKDEPLRDAIGYLLKPRYK